MATRTQKSAASRRKVIGTAVKAVRQGKKPQPQDIQAEELSAKGYQVDPEYESYTPTQYWINQLEQSRKTFEKWETRGQKVVKRYRDERNPVEEQRKKYNILWSNIQVLTPALYGRPAKPEVTRRFHSDNPVARTASELLERTLGYEVDQFPDFDASMCDALEDRLLPGRGTVWIRYEPNLVPQPPMEGQPSPDSGEPHETPQAEVAEEGAQITEDVENPSLIIKGERSPVDYVHWRDFAHSPARTWEEVWWVARRVWMTKAEGKERFGDKFDDVSIDYQEESFYDKEGRKESLKKKAQVWEIWDKTGNRICWLSKGYGALLDEINKDDPDPARKALLETFEGFFPCPEPLYATVTTGSLIPIPDYCQYQDQAEELDQLTQRISMLTKACKAVGVYNAEFKSLARVLVEGLDNTMFPVDSWAAFAEKGGIKGGMELMDVTQVIQVLVKLYEARDKVIQSIYDIFGIADIMRGATDPNETLGAQHMKASFGSLRLRAYQKTVAKFASEIFKKKAEVVCKFYQPESIIEMSGIASTLDGQNQELVQQAIQMLKSDTVRAYRIEVEADSLAQIDEQQDKAEAVEFLNAAGGFLEKLIPMVSQAPMLAGLGVQMMKFGVRRFHAGREIEAAFDQAAQAVLQQSQQPKPPDPKLITAQSQAQTAGVRAQAETAKAQLGVQEAQIEGQATVAKAAAETARANAEMAKAHADRQAQIPVTPMPPGPWIPGVQ